MTAYKACITLLRATPWDESRNLTASCKGSTFMMIFPLWASFVPSVIYCLLFLFVANDICPACSIGYAGRMFS